MLEWIAGHSAGWQYLAPFILLSALAGAFLVRSKRKKFLPWAILVPWVSAMVAYYYLAGVDRLWYYARPQWTAWVITLVIVLAIPFAVVLGLVVLPRFRAMGAIAGCCIAAIGGICSIPFAGEVAGTLPRYLDSWIR